MFSIVSHRRYSKLLDNSHNSLLLSPSQTRYSLVRFNGGQLITTYLQVSMKQTRERVMPLMFLTTGWK